MNAPPSSSQSADGVPLPGFVQIEPVGQCNLRCRMCPIALRQDQPAGGAPAFMDMATFRRLLDGFPSATVLQLQGLGEPMMHPRFFDMVREAAARGMEVSTNSNLTLLTPDRARECVSSGLAALHVSIDGATAATYESIRLGANFDKVLRNLDRIVAARAGLNSPTPALRIVTVLMRRNLHELADVVTMAHAHGVDSVFVQHLCHDFGDTAMPDVYRQMRSFVDAEMLDASDRERVERHFDEARRQAEHLGVKLRLPSQQTLTGDAPVRGCDWPWRGAYLSYRGETMPCCMVNTPDRISLGNMADRGVAAVWHGVAYRDFRAALMSDAPPEICRGCNLYRGRF